MRSRIRHLFMGIFLHVLLSGCILAGFRVYRSGYDHTHSEPIRTASLRVTEDTAELSVLSQSITLPLPPDSTTNRLAWFVLSDEHVKFWMLLFQEFTDQKYFVH